MTAKPRDPRHQLQAACRVC